jgi:acetoin utilization deacetylase AcuC-like enzyme
VVVIPVLKQFKPELIVISAGFDAHEADPLAQMRMTSTGLAYLTWLLSVAARDGGDVKVVLVTEGGYALRALGESLTGALTCLQRLPGTMSPLERPATGRGARAIAAVRTAQSGRWAGL